MRFEAIGTAWDISVPEGDISPDLQARILDRIAVYDAAYSRFRDDSLVAQMARKAGRYRLPDDAADLLGLYRELYDITDGLVTPLIGRLLDDAGYDGAYSLVPRTLTTPPPWDEVLRYEAPYLGLSRPALLDFGAAGKGYLTDLIGRLLEAAGHPAYTIDAGGDLLYAGPAGRPLRIGLEHPADPTLAIGVVELAGGSLCGSATNRRKWRGLHHIFNPRTLEPVRDVLAVWVVAASGLLADGLASALFFVPADRLQSRYNFEYVLIRPDLSFEQSAGFPGTLIS